MELIHLVKQMERILKKGFTRMEEYDKRMKEETKVGLIYHSRFNFFTKMLISQKREKNMF